MKGYKIQLDPDDSRYAGYFDDNGIFKRTMRIPTAQEWENRPIQPAPEMRFSSHRQRTQYENIVGHSAGSGSYPKRENERGAAGVWGEPDHYNARSRSQPSVKVTYAMPDGQPFPDEAYMGYMGNWPESKESDGMADLLKREKRNRVKTETEAVYDAIGKAMQEAADALFNATFNNAFKP